MKVVSYNFYRWRYESRFIVKFGLAWMFASLTGLGALMKFYIPWTPVSIAGQVFFVLAAAVVLGRHFGGLSQLIYALVGVAGIPWFAGSNADPVRLFEGLLGLYQGLGGVAIPYGATFGYIIGFIVAAFIIGWALDSRIRLRRYLHLTLPFGRNRDHLHHGSHMVLLLVDRWFWVPGGERGSISR